jgi:uncharacterized delta-60 repeat protein
MKRMNTYWWRPGIDLRVLYMAALLVLMLASYGWAVVTGDEAQKVVVDADGNVYVTGYSINGAGKYDYVTIKYGPNGNWLWGRRYNSPYNGNDQPCALVVDSSGNVYVTGYSQNSAGNADYVTIKYGPNGDWVWGRRYDSPYNSNDYATALAVDGAGNVYVTGYSQNSAGDPDYVTIKYGPSGNWLWGRRYDSPYSSGDFAQALAVDGAGNVYVTGPSMNSAGNEDYVTIKYGPSGNWLWGRRYDSPYNGDDEAEALAVDGAGNVYVTGYSWNGAGNEDYVTIKYGPSGNWLWGRRYNSPYNSSDLATALAVDAAGNVYVTGWSQGSARDADYVTIKYGPSGNWLWGRRFNSPYNGNDQPTALAVDGNGNGNVYVTGYSWNGANYDYVTIKYDANGNWVWGRRYDGPD